MVWDVIRIVIGSLLSTGILVVALLYVFKSSFERLLDQEVEKFKAKLSEDLERVKAELRLDESERNLKLRLLLEFRGRQLKEFYWPIYLGLQKDNVIWRRITDKNNPDDSLRSDLGTAIERDTILPNHNFMVSVIEKSLYLAEADDELLGELLHYLRHVAVYNALRTSKEARQTSREELFPDDVGESWPKDLFPMIEQRLKDLQEQYNELLRLQGRDSECE